MKYILLNLLLVYFIKTIECHYDYTVCSGRYANIGCSSGRRLRIKSAYTCSADHSCSSDEVCCNPDVSYDHISHLCNGHKYCVFYFDDYLLGDPRNCPSGEKCLHIDFTCEVDRGGPQQCGPNEFWNDCRSPCPPTCCSNPPKYCQRSCHPGCDCLPNYLRDPYTGICVYRDYCPIVNDSYEVFSQCNANDQNYCPSCEPGYVCKYPYVRCGRTGQCILPRDCPHYVPAP